MALDEQAQQTLREWMQSKGISTCPVCNQGVFNDGTAVLLLLPRRAAWRQAVPSEGMRQGAIHTSENPYKIGVRFGQRDAPSLLSKLGADFNKLRLGFLKMGHMSSDARAVVKVDCGNCANVLLLDAKRVGLIGRPDSSTEQEGGETEDI